MRTTATATRAPPTTRASSTRTLDARGRASQTNRATRVVTAAAGGPRNRLREKERRKASEERARGRNHEAEFDDYVSKHVATASPVALSPASEPRASEDGLRRAKKNAKKLQRKLKKAAQRAVDTLLPREGISIGKNRSSAPVRMGSVGAPTTPMMAYRPQRPSAFEAYGKAAVAWGGIFGAAWIALKLMNGENPVGAIWCVFKPRARPPPPGARGPGRWVGDRSLGGRQVWVPASEDRYRDERKRLEGALDVMPGGEGEGETSSMASAAAKTRSTGRGAAKPLPSWWVDPSPQYVPPGRKEMLIGTAKAEGAKLARKRVSGVGFSAEDIADFRSACAAAGERGCAVKSVGPEGARTAVFRAAADIAVTDAMRGQAGAMSSFNTPVGPFLAGLCDDLALVPSKCVSIVTADVAARVRGALVQAGAGIRSGDGVSVMLELNKLINLFNTFPFAPGAPELDMLSVGLKSRLTDAEREALVREYENIAGGAHAQIVREAVFGNSPNASMDG
jgi:hypothetical protein